jgi:hypothetical protein
LLRWRLAAAHAIEQHDAIGAAAPAALPPDPTPPSARSLQMSLPGRQSRRWPRAAGSSGRVGHRGTMPTSRGQERRAPASSCVCRCVGYLEARGAMPPSSANSAQRVHDGSTHPRRMESERTPEQLERRHGVRVDGRWCVQLKCQRVWTPRVYSPRGRHADAAIAREQGGGTAVFTERHISLPRNSCPKRRVRPPTVSALPTTSPPSNAKSEEAAADLAR